VSAADATLDELRVLLAPQVARSAMFDGWSHAAVDAAALGAGVDPAVARLAFPDAMSMISGWVAAVDARMEAAFGAGQLDGVPVREKIRRLVLFRLETVRGLEEALSRALAIQAMPQNVPAALRLGWSSADIMWRLAGDTATDYNHYTKRAILAGIYAATLAVYIDDTSDGKADSLAFLDRRIDGVMRFEKAKGQLLAKREGFDVMRFLGRLRYPAT
jgi:ubiquinone biosynthesis protein COQ9